MQDLNGAYQIWMRRLSAKAENTRLRYISNFKEFLVWCKKSPDQLRQLKMLEEKQKEPWLRTEVENLVRQHIAFMQKKKLSGSTIHMRLCAIRSFFKSQNLPLHLNREDQPAIDNLNAKGTPNKKEVKEINECALTLRDHALILFLKDTGLRVSDLPQLRWNHLVDVGDGFYKFKIVTVKRHTVARGFIGPETSEALQRYKTQRLQGTRNVPAETNIKNHPLFARLNKCVDDTNTLDTNALRMAVRRAIVIAGFANKFSSHSLRKFWEQSMRSPREAYLKQLNGRALNSEEKAYYWRTEEQLLELYRENYDNLRILGSLIKHSEIDAIVEQRLKERIGDRDLEIEKLKKQVSRFEGLYERVMQMEKKPALTIDLLQLKEQEPEEYERFLQHFNYRLHGPPERLELPSDFWTKPRKKQSQRHKDK